jgi:hypothetical protein
MGRCLPSPPRVHKNLLEPKAREVFVHEGGEERQRPSLPRCKHNFLYLEATLQTFLVCRFRATWRAFHPIGNVEDVFLNFCVAEELNGLYFFNLQDVTFTNKFYVCGPQPLRALGAPHEIQILRCPLTEISMLLTFSS